MRITYYGQTCTRLVQSGLPSIITDPYPKALGKRAGGKKLSAEIATFSAGRPADKLPFRDLQHVLDGPGEYEIGGLFIHGLPIMPNLASHDAQPQAHSAFLFHDDGITILHLGPLTERPATPNSLLPFDEPLSALLLPLGACLTGQEAAELTRALQPIYVVPLYCDIPASGLEASTALKEFVSALDQPQPEPQSSLQLSSSTLAAEAGTQIIPLKPA